MKEFGDYLYKKVKVICVDDIVFQGDVVSYGGAIQGEEDYGRAEDFIVVYTGDADYVLFSSEVKDIVEI